MEIKKPKTPKEKKAKKKKSLSDTSPAFQRLAKDMKTQPKDASGKFINRTFAQYASNELKKIRESGKAAKAKTPKKTK